MRGIPKHTWSFECIRELHENVVILLEIMHHILIPRYEWLKIGSYFRITKPHISFFIFTMIFNIPDPQGNQTLLNPGEISSVYLNTQVHLLQIVGYQMGSVSLCNFCSDRWGSLTPFTRHYRKTEI